MSTGLTTKRTPRKRKPNQPSAAELKLEAFGIDAVCECIMERMHMISIAQQIGVSFTAFMHWIEQSEERTARLKSTRTQMAKVWDEEAERRIEEAEEEFDLKKARELAHHYRWRSSKIAPKEYGDKVAVGGAEDLPPVATIDATKLSAKALQELMRAKRDDDR